MNLKTRISLLETLIVSSALTLVFLVTYYLISFSLSEIEISVAVLLMTLAVLGWPLRMVLKRFWLNPLSSRDFSEMSPPEKLQAVISANRFPYLSATASLLWWYVVGALTAFLVWIFSGMEPIKVGIFYGAVVTGGTTAALYQFYLIKRTLQPILEDWLSTEVEIREYETAFFRTGIRAKFLITFSLFVGVFLCFSAVCLLYISRDISRKNFNQLAQKELHRISTRLAGIEDQGTGIGEELTKSLEQVNLSELAGLRIVNAQGVIQGETAGKLPSASPEIMTLKVPLSRGNLYLEGVFVPQLSSDPVSRGIFPLLVLIAGILFITIVCAYFAAQDVSRPIALLGKAIKSAARGDFRDHPLPITEDEVGVLSEGLGGMLQDLGRMTRRIDRTYQETQKVNRGIFVSIKEIARRAELQAVSLEQGISAVEEMSQTMGETTNNTRILSEAGENISKYTGDLKIKINEVTPRADLLFHVIEEAGGTIRKLNETMGGLAGEVSQLVWEAGGVNQKILSVQQSAQDMKRQTREAVADAQGISGMAGQVWKTVQGTGESLAQVKKLADQDLEQVGILKDQAEDIGGILTVIDEVAEDTRLLSLNAAIIAVQAREEGRGFAVVAGGIRELADQTRTSIANVTDLIRSVQTQGLEAVEAIRQGAGQAHAGVEAALGVQEKIQEMDATLTQLKETMLLIERVISDWVEGVNRVAASLQSFTVEAGEVSRVGNEQSRISNQVAANFEEVRKISSLIKKTMTDLAQGSTMIKKATESIGQMAGEFERIGISRRENTEKIMRGMREIQAGAEANRMRSRDLEKTVAFLGIQADKLKGEVEKFRW
ncbi:MAG: methyl-accepting chemotaxis protein [bacterium]|nr:methyl-accepting chemotaxis protein [bacterium]